MPHLLVDISSHGYGHVSQTAPVVNELARRIPGLRVTLRSAAPCPLLAQRFSCKFHHIPIAFDFGMCMANALDVQVDESALAYNEFHADWQDRVARAADEMRTLQPDLLLANVPYLSLAAAQLAGVRAVGMCSLNWADIYHHYCVRDAASRTIHTQMLDAYNSAECFLKVQPAMPMADFHRVRSIGPVARLGHKQRAHILDQCSLGNEEKLILVAMGGIEFRLPMEHWPRIPGVRWLVPQAWNIERDDMIGLESLELPFSDVLASSDAVLTKPGYGMFVEAACAGVPVLYVTRRNWPEEPCLVRWLEAHNRCLEVSREVLQTGELADILNRLWVIHTPDMPVPSGAGEAADYLATLF